MTNNFVNYFKLKFKHSETKVPTSQSVSTSRNAHPLTVSKWIHREGSVCVILHVKFKK